MRERLTICLAVTLATFLGAGQALASEVVVSGGGWGHGIGMSQHGARAMAESGSSAEDILTYFYTGAQIGTVGEGDLVGHANPLRIGVDQDVTQFDFEAVGGPVNVCVNGNCVLTASPGDGKDWSYRSNGSGSCRFYNGEVAVTSATTCVGELTWSSQPSTRVSAPQLNRTYARGRILFLQAPDGLFHVVVELNLEDYLYGLGEMPSSWPAEALKAQAIAGRTFALYKAWVWRNIGTGAESTPGELKRLADCACHLYSSTWDQKYIGWAKESESSGGVDWGVFWVEAVDDTAGLALIHAHSGGRAIEAYYFSSSGGATENNEEVWGGTPYPYLRSVADPGATQWQKAFSQVGFASALGFVCVGSAQIISVNASGSPSAIQIQGSDPSGPTTRTYTGNQLRTKLSLLSHYITSIDGLSAGSAMASDGDHLLGYRGSDGQWWYRDVDGAGCSLETLGSGSYGVGWTHVEALDVDGDERDELLFYRSSDGLYEYRDLNSDGTLGSVRLSGNWAPGWTAVEAVRFQGEATDDLMFYRVSDGRFAYYDLGPNGTIGSAVRVGYFGPGWTSSEPLDINGDGVDEMFFYRKSDGRFAYYYLRPDGTIGHSVRKANFGVGWDIIEPTDFDGDGTSEMLYYRKSDGRYAMYDLSLGGHIGSSLGVGNYDPQLASITSPRPD